MILKQSVCNSCGQPFEYGQHIRGVYTIASAEAVNHIFTVQTENEPALWEHVTCPPAAQLCEVYFFSPTGKWKYTDTLLLASQVSYATPTPFTQYIQDGLANTPAVHRKTTIRMTDGWTIVSIENPLGYPIMIPGKVAR